MNNEQADLLALEKKMRTSQLAKMLRALCLLDKMIDMHTEGKLEHSQIQMVFAGVCEPIWAMSCALNIMVADLFDESEREALRVMESKATPDNQEDGS